MDMSCIGGLPDKEEWKEQPKRCQDTILLVKLLTETIILIRNAHLEERLVT